MTAKKKEPWVPNLLGMGELGWVRSLEADAVMEVVYITESSVWSAEVQWGDLRWVFGGHSTLLKAKKAAERGFTKILKDMLKKI